jgi:hypothetical protein
MKRMRNEAVLRKTITKHLVDKFGVIDTERYIASITRDPIDYTEWRRDMYDDLSIDELSAKAMAFHKELHNECGISE